MTQPRKIKQPNFDRVARLYRWAEYLTLGPLLQRTRTHFLAQLPPRHNALLLGDGDGRFLAQLFARQPHLHALAVDTSATMLHLLRRRCHPYTDRLQTLQASALTLETIHSPKPPAPATLGYPKASALGPDLITTHFFLDCLTQPEVDALTRNLASTLQPGALWLLSDFGQPRPRALRPLASLYIRALYLAFRVLTGLRVTHLPDPQSSLRRAGFRRIARHDLLCGLLYTEIWEDALESTFTGNPMDLNPPARPINDPQSDPEPAAPSLPAPDPAVYHPQPTPTNPPPPTSKESIA